MNEVLLKAEGIYKSFGATKAVVDFHIEVCRGTIHGLIGENGSGKSTFSSIVAGIQQRDSGRLLLRGEDYAPTSSVDAAKQGKFLSKDDFRDRTKVSKTVIDLMDDLKLFGDIPQSNQMSLFDFTG